MLREQLDSTTDVTSKLYLQFLVAVGYLDGFDYPRTSWVRFVFEPTYGGLRALSSKQD
jgi:hypothetical protein